MQTDKTIQKILHDIRFDTWSVVFRKNRYHPYLQVMFLDKCITTGEVKEQRCRKWMLSYHMTETEIVHTAFKAVMAAMEHEVREKFQYKGKNIFNPHIDVNVLTEICERHDVRKEVKNELNY